MEEWVLNPHLRFLLVDLEMVQYHPCFRLDQLEPIRFGRCLLAVRMLYRLQCFFMKVSCHRHSTNYLFGV